MVPELWKEHAVCHKERTLRFSIPLVPSPLSFPLFKLVYFLIYFLEFLLV